MDKLNIVLIIMIFTSLVIIIGIFGKNLKNFKQAEKSLKLRDEMIKKRKKEGKFSFGFIFSKISDFFVWIAETVVNGAGNALKSAHAGLIELKAKKGIKDGVQKMSTKIEGINAKTSGMAEKISQKKINVLKGRFSKNASKVSDIGILDEKQANRMDKMEGNIENEVDLKKDQEKDSKLKEFFRNDEASLKGTQNSSPNNDYFEQQHNLEVEESYENKNNNNLPKKSFFSKINPFRKEETIRERKILTEESFNEFSDGITVINNDFVAEEDVFLKDVVRTKHVSRKDMNDDEELGIDRKILEKRILQKIAASPKDIEGYRQLGELYIKMENFDDACSAYKFILKVSARDVDASRKLEKIKLLKRLK